MAIPIIMIITMTTMMTNNMFNLTKTIKLPHRRNKTTRFPAFSFAWTSSASEWKVFSDFLHFHFSMCFEHIFSTNVPRSSEMNVPTILLYWIFLDYPSINPIHNPHGHQSWAPQKKSLLGQNHVLVKTGQKCKKKKVTFSQIYIRLLVDFGCFLKKEKTNFRQNVETAVSPWFQPGPGPLSLWVIFCGLDRPTKFRWPRSKIWGTYTSDCGLAQNGPNPAPKPKKGIYRVNGSALKFLMYDLF